MLDKWLIELAEQKQQKEKTAADQLSESMEDLSMDELDLIYQLSDQKEKEASLRGAGRRVFRTIGSIGKKEDVSKLKAFDDELMRLEGTYRGLQSGYKKLGLEGQLSNALPDRIKLVGGRRGELEKELVSRGKRRAAIGAPIALGTGGLTVGAAKLLKDRSKERQKIKQSSDQGVKEASVGSTLKSVGTQAGIGTGLGALGGGLHGGLGGAIIAPKGDKKRGFWEGAKAGVVPGAVIGGLSGAVLGGVRPALAEDSPRLSRFLEVVDDSVQRAGIPVAGLTVGGLAGKKIKEERQKSKKSSDQLQEALIKVATKRGLL